MTSMQAAALAAQVVAAAAGILLARRHAPHVPAAIALVVLAAANLLQVPILAALHPLPRPVEGAARVLVYLDGALSLSYYAILAGLPVALAFPERRRRAVAVVVGAWLLASVVLALFYPSPVVRGAGLQQLYIGADFIALGVAALALIIEGRAENAAGRSPSSASAVATALVLLDGGLLVAPFSPWRSDVFAVPYFVPQLVLAIIFVFIAVSEVVWSRHV